LSRIVLQFVLFTYIEGSRNTGDFSFQTLLKKNVIGPAGPYTDAGLHISALAVFIAEYYMSK